MVKLGQSPNNINELNYLNQNAIAMFNYMEIENHDLKYGSQNEQNEINAYELHTRQKVTPTGMWIFPDSPLYSCPDGILYSKHTVGEIYGVIEVKCPSSYELRTPAKLDMKYLTSDGHLDHNSQYYYQVQGHLAATNAPWCDFIIWSEDMLHVERIRPDLDWFNNKLPMIKWGVVNKLLPISYELDFWDKVKNSLLK